MKRSPIMRNLARSIRVAHYCERNHISTREGLERVAAVEERVERRRTSRREFLVEGLGKLAVVGALGAAVGRATADLDEVPAKPVGARPSTGAMRRKSIGPGRTCVVMTTLHPAALTDRGLVPELDAS